MSEFENLHPRKAVGTFTDKDQGAPEIGLAQNQYADQEPPAIDAVLARLSGEQQRWLNAVYLDSETIRKLNEEEEVFEKTGVRRNRWGTEPAVQIERAEKRIIANRAQAEEVQLLIDPIDEEFTARGGWTRFFVTMGSNPHVHSSMSCSTCYPTTQFGWLTDHSGMNEDEIVELAGDEACTVCFPTAPVADRSSPRQNRLETPEGRAARIEREEAKTARDAKKAASSIVAPNGEPVYDDYSHPFKTERAAEVNAVGGLSSALWYDDHPEEPTWFRIAANVEDAIAAKRGITVGELRVAWTKKLRDKAKRDGAESQFTEKGATIFDGVDEYKRTRAKLEAEWDAASVAENQSDDQKAALVALAQKIDLLIGRKRGSRY